MDSLTPISPISRNADERPSFFRAPKHYGAEKSDEDQLSISTGTAALVQMGLVIEQSSARINSNIIEFSLSFMLERHQQMEVDGHYSRASNKLEVSMRFSQIEVSFENRSERLNGTMDLELEGVDLKKRPRKSSINDIIGFVRKLLQESMDEELFAQMEPIKESEHQTSLKLAEESDWEAINDYVSQLIDLTITIARLITRSEQQEYGTNGGDVPLQDPQKARQIISDQYEASFAISRLEIRMESAQISAGL